MTWGPALASDNRTRLAAGGDTTCALRANHVVMCWGQGGRGQLGDGLFTSSYLPVQVSGIDDAVAIDVGTTHACAVRGNGGVSCWGLNNFGQLGNGVSQGNSGVPVTVLVVGNNPVAGMVSVSAADDHTCALGDAGDVWCWGGDKYGQIGQPPVFSNPYAQQVVFPPGTGAQTRLTTYTRGTCSLDASTRMWCWGDNSKGAVGIASAAVTVVDAPRQVVTPFGALDGVTAIGGGVDHVCAVSNTVTYCWGSNFMSGSASGQIGQGPAVALSTYPQAVGSTQGSLDVIGGGGHTIVLRTDGQGIAWGAGNGGQLGQGMFDTSFIVPVGILAPF